MMKKIGALVMILGLIIAVCIQDGSEHELLFRLSGITMFVIGALMSDVLKIKND